MNPCTREAGGGATRRISFSLTVTVASGAATMPASSSSDSKHAEGKEIEEHGDENGKWQDLFLQSLERAACVV